MKVDYQLHVRDLKIGPKRAWSRPAIACLGTINQTLEARSAKQAAPVRCKVSLKCCSFALRRCTPKQVSRLALRYDAQLHFELTNRASVRKAYSYVRRVDGRAAALNRREAPRERLCELRCELAPRRRAHQRHGRDCADATASGMNEARLAPRSTQGSRASLLISTGDFDELTIPSARTSSRFASRS